MSSRPISRIMEYVERLVMLGAASVEINVERAYVRFSVTSRILERKFEHSRRVSLREINASALSVVELADLHERAARTELGAAMMADGS